VFGFYNNYYSKNVVTDIVIVILLPCHYIATMIKVQYLVESKRHEGINYAPIRALILNKVSSLLHTA